MIRFLRDLLSRPGFSRTVILLDPETPASPRQYDVRPGYAVYATVAGVVLLAVGVGAVLALGTSRGRLPPSSGDDLRGVAERTAARAAALEDSLALQYQQIAQLRALITGDVEAMDEMARDPDAFPAPDASSRTLADPPSGAETASRPGPQGQGQPAFPLRTLGPASERSRDLRAASAYIDGLRLPAPPPVDGVLSRGFDAGRGHFAVDLAAREGTPVRAVGEGYVVFADWTHDGGHSIAVQHPDGYLSVYKHNSRLLKRVGERVRAREVLALSGNTGEVTSGPHLHFELWRDGFAQDPAGFLLMP